MGLQNILKQMYCDGFSLPVESETGRQIRASAMPVFVPMLVHPFVPGVVTVTVAVAVTVSTSGVTGREAEDAAGHIRPQYEGRLAHTDADASRAAGRVADLKLRSRKNAERVKTGEVSGVAFEFVNLKLSAARHIKQAASFMGNVCIGHKILPFLRPAALPGIDASDMRRTAPVCMGRDEAVNKWRYKRFFVESKHFSR